MVVCASWSSHSEVGLSISLSASAISSFQGLQLAASCLAPCLGHVS